MGQGAGEVRYNVPFCCCFAANSYCGNLFRLFHRPLGDEKSTFPKGEGFSYRKLNLKTSIIVL